MKNETLEQELKLVKHDYMELLKQSRQVYLDYQDKYDFLLANVKVLFSKLEMNIRNKVKCNDCEGKGTVYVSPICDYEGRGNKCLSCNGDGIRWI